MVEPETWNVTTLKEFVMALDSARQEADHIAGAEREKAALALRESLIEQTKSGDENLRTHIIAQELAVQAALAALNDTLHQRDKAIEVARTYAEQANAKAEAATSQRLDMMNKFREQISDQAATFVRREAFEVFKETSTHRDALLLPREIFDAQMDETRRWRSQTQAVLDKQAGRMAAYAGMVVFMEIAVGIVLYAISQ